MIKLFGLLRRRHDLSLEQFSRHWSTVHRELALRLVAPGIMRGYVQNHREPVAVPGLDAPVDGSPEVWIDGPHILERLATAPAYLEGAYPDERNFMEGDSDAMMTRTVFGRGIERERTTPGAKVMFYFPQQVATDPRITSARWQSDSPWLLPGSSPLRLEREQALTGDAAGGITPRFGAIEASWWPDVETFLERWQKRPADAESRAHEDGVRAMFVRELIVLAPDAGA